MTSALDEFTGPAGSLTGDRLRPGWPISVTSSGTSNLVVMGDAPYVVVHHRDLDPWLEQRLHLLSNLPPGWDEDGARSISPALIRQARQFLASDLISQFPIRPDVVPTYAGGLLIEWHTESLDLIIEMDPTSAVSFYLHDEETESEVEAPIGQHTSLLASAFARLLRHS
jgi:hypothetical protein